MPTSPLPNSAVSLLPPEDIVVVLVELLSPPLPQAARKAASAVEPPPTARNLRREWGPASCFTSGIASRLPVVCLPPPTGSRRQVDQNPPMFRTASDFRPSREEI